MFMAAIANRRLHGEIQPRPISYRRNHKLLTTMRLMISCLELATDLSAKKNQSRKNFVFDEATQDLEESVMLVMEEH
jgi:hypothetical protein